MSNWLSKHPDGSEVNKSDPPKSKWAKYQLVPPPASESTSITYANPMMGNTATTGRSKQQMEETHQSMSKSVLIDQRNKQKRIQERKDAVAAKEKNIPFTLPDGTSKKYGDMDFRERGYVDGKSLELKGRFFENDESPIDDYLNPYNWLTQMAAGLGEAPYTAKQTNSNLPYLSAIGTPVAMGAMGFDPLGSAMKVPAKIAQSTESGLLSNTYKLNPWAFKPNPEAYYRTLGKEGIDDAFNSGVIRPKQTSNIYSPELGKRVDVNVPEFPEGSYFNKSGLYSNNKIYNPDYIAEVVGKDNLFTYPERIVFNENIRVAPNNIPIEEANFYKKDWLQGYKEISKPTSTQEVISTSSGMDALPKGYNSHLFKKQGYVPPTTNPNLMAKVNKVPIADTELGITNIQKAMESASNIYTPLKTKYNKYKEYISDNEAWKLGENERRLINNPSLNDEFISTDQQVSSIYTAKMQQMHPDNIIYNNMKPLDLIPNTPNSGSNWYGGMKDNPNAHYMSDFADYKMDPKYRTFDAAKDAARKDAGEYFQSTYKKYIMHPLEQINIPKNKNGGKLIATKGKLKNY